jgi:phage terminase large subunit-like protein
VTTGTTYENIENLSDEFKRLVLAKYEGTSLGQQEIYAALLEEAEGALWTRDLLTQTRVGMCPDGMTRTVVAVDPAITKGAESAETGIIVASRNAAGEGYVVADYSGRYSPAQWAKRVADAYDRHNADRVVVEVNQGGDMVRHVLTTERPTLPVKEVHAADGKRTRAEPVAALYEQGTVHHVGVFPTLEDQLCTWVPDTGEPSPDRLDALVWGLTELLHTRVVPTATPGGVGQHNQWRVA